MGNKEYLGDGVYVDIENGMIKLTTENSIETTNTIYLEVEVLEAFRRWCDHTLRTPKE